MGEVHYMISETAKQVNVEPHVLRYWEEELDLPIGRNDMGHRFYTEENIQLFDCIKELKEQGLSLKELKALIPDILLTKEKLKHQKNTSKKADQQLLPKNQHEEKKEDTATPSTLQAIAPQVPEKSPASNTPKEAETMNQQEDKMELLIKMMSDVIEKALLQNNKILEEAVSNSVNNKVVKNMDYLLQARERQEEDRYRKLDHLIRQQQAIRKESAKMGAAKKLRRLIGEV